MADRDSKLNKAREQLEEAMVREQEESMAREQEEAKAREQEESMARELAERLTVCVAETEVKQVELASLQADILAQTVSVGADPINQVLVLVTFECELQLCN